MKVNELLRILKEHGCYCDHSGKRHDIWFSPINGRTFPVERHSSKELGTGMVQKILKEAGIK